ncbi:MAG: ester cyclase [Chloroflexi bacterium]|nr:ester cyclase [Chloroflexota bacterium]
MMSVTSSETLIRRYYEAWTRNDQDTLSSLLTTNAVNHHLETGERRDAQIFELSTCELWHCGFSEVRLTFLKIVATAEFISSVWTLDSIHTGEFLKLPATGKRVHVPGIETARVENGQIAEIWRIFDQVTLMNQLRG